MSSQVSARTASRSVSASYLGTAVTSRPRTGRSRTARPRTALSTLAGVESQEIICAISESRGVSPVVGLAFVNLETCEAVLCQLLDSQTYVRTIQKIAIYGPSEILLMSTSSNPKSKLFSIVEENLDLLGFDLTTLDRRFWCETAGFEYIQTLALSDDVEAIKAAISSNYFAVCCIAAALRYVEVTRKRSFPYNSLRIKYEPSEGAMMIDSATVHSIELIQNLNNARSKDCLFGLLNETQTPMGARLLRANILQPLTNADTINCRFDSVEELVTTLEKLVDADKLLTALIVTPMTETVYAVEQNINNVIMLKQFVAVARQVFHALVNARSGLLVEIREYCAPHNLNPVEQIISTLINDDVKYSKSPLDLRYQRTFAIRSGVNGLLDVSRQTFKESSEDALNYVNDLSQRHGLKLNLKYDNGRKYYIRTPRAQLDGRPLPPELVNVTKNRDFFECSTLDLMKFNTRIIDAHNECIILSDETVQALIASIREHAAALFKICESLAMLDMLNSFALLAKSQNYVRPEIGDTLAIEAGRHPIKERIQAKSTKFVPNDIYATQQKRLQIITGANMSGKSTYIRTIALIAVMAQIGSFIPASYATLPIHRQLFARVNVDDSLDANISTFMAEMQETAYILRNIDKHSLAIVDELGRGTSTRDGLAIAIAIAEALVDSRAFVWFATHFTQLATILAERPGVVALHLAVDNPDANTLTPLYRVAAGICATPAYGLALARLVPLPPAMLETAAIVAGQLREREEARRQASPAVLAQRRRRLILDLREHLLQAQAGCMEGETLAHWLRELQNEFVRQMAATEEASEAAQFYSEESHGHEDQSDTMESDTIGGSDFTRSNSVDDVERRDTQSSGTGTSASGETMMMM